MSGKSSVFYAGRNQTLVMAALCSRCGHYIFALWFLLSFFLAYSQPSQIGCLSYFHTCCGLSVNSGCRSATCCTWLAKNTRRKNRHLHSIAQLCRVISLQLRHVSTVRKKLVKQQYVLHMSW